MIISVGEWLATTVPALPFNAHILPDILNTVIFIANLAGAIVVGVAALRALAAYSLDLVRDRGGEVPKEAIRLSLGRSFALALEFQVGADILSTALNPAFHDVLVLGAIVVLRTVLNFFLERELRQAALRKKDEISPRHVAQGNEQKQAV